LKRVTSFKKRKLMQRQGADIRTVKENGRRLQEKKEKKRDGESWITEVEVACIK